MKDDQSSIVGVGHFEQGIGAQQVPPNRTGAGTYINDTAHYYTACQFGFSVTGLPRRPFYVVSTGTRSGVTYSFAQLQSASWTITLTIGSN